MAASTLTGPSHLGVTDNQKRWLVAGIALNKILIPQIRPSVEQGINTEYNNLKASHNIHGQSTSGRLQRWPPGKFLKYENINGNDVHPRLPGGKFNYSLFDCRVTSHVDFARLYVENYMAKFTAFDDHCDASAVLLLLGWVPAFNMAVQTAADVVRSVRNDWAHCVFSKWDQPKFLKSFSEMEQLVRSMALPTADETKLLGELKDWESKGTHLCMNSPVDPALLQLVQQELQSLHDVLDNMSVELVEEKTKVQHELGSISAALEEVKQRIQRLETGQKNLESCAELAQSRINDFQGDMSKRMEMLESCQQNTDSRTVLIEDRVNNFEGHVQKKMEMLENNQQGTESRTALVEDRVNVVEDSVHHLQGHMSKRMEMLESCQQSTDSRTVFVEDKVNRFEGHLHKKMKMLENNQQGTESRTALVEDRVNVVEDSVHHLQGHVHKKMKMLENNQQGTESRTALVEDRVNVVEDSVHHLQEQMDDLAKSKEPDVTMSCQGSPKTAVCPERLAGIIRRDYKGAVLCPFPWCEDELQLELSKIFTRLKIVGKKKERARLTDEIVNMTDVFKSHEECQEPRVVLIEGQPGMGKTTYCQKLAYDWSVEDISPEASFPKVNMLLVLKCRDMKTANIEEAIDDQLLPLDTDEKEKEEFFNFIRCNQSKILLVLDGLDELSDDHFKALLPLIQGKRFSNTYLMLTARHEAGMKVRRYCDTLLEIVGYTSEDADSYITKYFSNHDDPSLAEKLISQLKRDRRLRELTTNPLNTALLCLLCEDTEGVFPSNRTKMYTELVSCAIRRYFARKSVPLDARDPVETYSDNLNQLGKVALKALKADRMYFSEEEIKCQSIDFLRLCFLSQEASVSKLRPMPCYAFTHKTFQEYFAAYHLTFEILSGNKDTVDTLLAQLSPVGKYWQLWEFLLTMVASKSGEAATLVISGFCAAFQSQRTELTEEQMGQDSDCDDDDVDDDNDASDDNDFDICEDLVNVFPDINHWFRWSLTEDEEMRASTLTAVFSLISKCEGGKNEVTDSQKKMVRVLAESFPIQKLDTKLSETGMPSNVKILLEYLKSNSTLTFLSWRHPLDDSVLETIEQVLRSNRALKTLDLLSISSTPMFWERRTSNHFSLTTILANTLCSNCTVTHLNLRCRSIFSPGANEIAQALQSNHTLTHINLEGNYIDDSAAENFAGVLRSGSALMYLDLSSNRIGDSGAVALGKALESNRTLTYLDLGYSDSPGHGFLEQIFLMRGGDVKRNRIGDSGATAFAQALLLNSVLARLNLQHNRISDRGAAALGLSLKSNRTLTHLCLRGNRIENAGVAYLGHALQVDCGIVNLDLRSNDLMQSEASASSLAGALRLNSVLTHLDLRHTLIGCHVATTLADSLQSNSTLTRVDLYGNMINSSGGVALAKALLTNRSLTHLNLRFNIIGDSGAAEFVEALQTNNTLAFLDLRNNGIREGGAKKIHGFLRALYDTQISRSSRRTLLYNWRC